MSQQSWRAPDDVYQHDPIKDSRERDSPLNHPQDAGVGQLQFNILKRGGTFLADSPSSQW